jgi:hypothetical protein
MHFHNIESHSRDSIAHFDQKIHKELVFSLEMMHILLLHLGKIQVSLPLQ